MLGRTVAGVVLLAVQARPWKSRFRRTRGRQFAGFSLFHEGSGATFSTVPWARGGRGKITYAKRSVSVYR